MIKMKDLFNARHLHSYPKVFALSILILLIFGVLPSLLKSDWTWFGRSGALLVLFGVYIVWLDYKGIIDDSLNSVLDGFRTYLDTLTTEQKRENIIKIFEEGKIQYTDIEIDKYLEQDNTDKNFKIFSEKFNEVSKLTHKRIQNIEFITLVLGTFIWGYGDLIDKIEFKSSTPIEYSKQNEDKNVSK